MQMSDMIPIKHKGKIIGHMWREVVNSEIEWHCEHCETGISWACDFKKEAEQCVLDHQRDLDNTKEK